MDGNNKVLRNFTNIVLVMNESSKNAEELGFIFLDNIKKIKKLLNSFLKKNSEICLDFLNAADKHLSFFENI